jgi:hypothetical protein
MEDEYDRLMEFFSLEEEEKEKKLDEIFKEMSRFFEKYKEVQAKGHEEDKKAIQKKMDTLKRKIREEKEGSEKRLGVSPDEVRQLASDPKNFTPAQWAILQNAEKALQEEKEERKKQETEQKKKRTSDLKQKNKKKKNSKRSSWLKS